MLKKLRAKFVFVNMAIVLTMLLVIFGMFYHFTRLDLEKDTQTALRTMAQRALQPGTPRPLDSSLPYFTLRINAWGEIVAAGVIGYDIEDEAFLHELIQELYQQRENEGYLEKYGLRYCRVSGGGVFAAAFVDDSSHVEVLQTIVVTGVGIGTVSLIVFFLISLLLARWMVKPVDTAWKKQKQFISDASHELKTPLTVIMSNAELLQTVDEAGQKERYCSNILTMSHRMRDLVEGLLNLSRVENGQIKQSFERQDFSRIAEAAILPFEPLFFEKGLTFRSQIEDGIFVIGNERYLSQLIQILLDNALKYSAPGIVDLQLQRKGRNQTLLTVSNPGNPIDREEQEHIFDRFYRSDQARTGSGSFGLGLAIAKTTVLEHGGRIWVDSNQTGSCFSVLLPSES